MNFSKSKYCLYCQCPKILWLNKYKPEEFKQDSSAEERFATGNVVGDLAMQLFGEFTEVTAYDKDGKLDLSKMIENTNECLKNGTENICEASFSSGGLFCSCDILRKEKDGYAIYEVKSSTHVSAVYITDITYQKHVLEKCGIKVTGTYIVHINNQYLLESEFDMQKFFTIKDVSNLVEEEATKHDIEKDLIEATKICDCNIEPNIDLSINCREPYTCGYWEYCSRHLPHPNVFDVYRMNFDKKSRLIMTDTLNLVTLEVPLNLTNYKNVNLILCLKI